MPTEAYALCPMPSRTSYESSKGYIRYLRLSFSPKAEDIDNVFSFTSAFMQEQDIYIPNPHYQKELRARKRVNLRPKGPTLDNLVRSDLERVGYIEVK